MTESKAMIVGSAGLTLTDDEIAFFRDERPWGFIVFSRNIDGAGQLTDLVASVRECVGRSDMPVFIDQEGGRVQRLVPPLAPQYPPGAAIGELYARDRDEGLRAAWLLARLHAFDLKRYGINADCLPILDVPVAGAHDIIGDRAYGRRPEQVEAIGRAVMQGLLDGGVLPVIKHIPGHGRAGVDSHVELPVVTASREELEQDFAPFRGLNEAVMGMTAHVIYTALDAEHPATTSSTVVNDIIRGQIGFDGLLMSDDLCMEAMSGTYAERAEAVFAAGCDMALHCNGQLDEMRDLASKTPLVTGEIAARAERAKKPLGRDMEADEEACRHEFSELMGVFA
ncbi:beta-N-acetylhexosaminidase [Notoacmeibacter sp. MSK16QG-6]|uniref:beta-N-acetylhexosaminidase n=1 Tax=Notoacmeibacter sp. MSK16QG-6 TaxID=2957982 RepID=UPI0020A14BD8|nr:beta-N-acetylhexosaminidase [Notoacmeibacter sp. MSK16QG-6]MCP1199392.1 beta-N-acetylhexosaminidase [Notoacmeibacter sp. MSK16QG-6]